jgi:hypothetical protein
MKAYKWSGSIAPVILNLYISWRWVVSLMPWLLYSPEKSPHCSWYRRLSGPQKWFGSYGKGEKNPRPCQDLSPISSSPQPDQLYWLHYHGCCLHQVMHSWAVIPVCCPHVSFPQLINYFAEKCNMWVVSWTKIQAGVVWIKFTPYKYTTIWPAAEHSECLRSNWPRNSQYSTLKCRSF